MTKAEKIDAVYREMGKAGAWRYTEVAAFIVERDAKRDAAWMRYADARVELARAQEMSGSTVIAAAEAELREAKEALRAVGIDTEAL